jgi:four helix bundle protein
MFLPLAHTKFDVYRVSGQVILEVYKLMTLLPADEKFILVSQIKRTAVSIKLNIAEGASRKTALERKRFYEIARGSVVELDSAICVCVELGYFTIERADVLGKLMYRTYGMLSKLTSKE